MFRGVDVGRSFYLVDLRWGRVVGMGRVCFRRWLLSRVWVEKEVIFGGEGGTVVIIKDYKFGGFKFKI